MEQQGFNRRLSAILSADAVGYSRLMAEDEDETVRILAAHRQFMVALIEKYKGQVVHAPGDNVLAIFISVLDAVRCAVEIQQELNAKNAELSENQKMEFRIGINLGDIIVERETIHGNGVNIAARMEGLAEDGGICLTGTVFDSIEHNVGFECEYLGEHIVKNIDKPIRVYKVILEPGIGEAGGSPKGGGKRVQQPADRSIAVLPFVNMSDDPKQEIFCDGLTEGIIATLSKSPNLFVIARNSSFTYKGKSVIVQQVGRELGVRFVLEGSVQKSGGRVRITAQLVDTSNGNHMWAERYDREMTEVFALQDEIAIHLMEAMQWKLSFGAPAREALGKGTRNIDAYFKLVEGQRYLVRGDPEGYIQAEKFIEKAISLDPTYATPYIFLGVLLTLKVKLGMSRSPVHALKRASEMAERALELDRSHPSLYILLGLLELVNRRYDLALASYEKAFIIDRNNIISIYNQGECLIFMGKPEESISVFEKILPIDPLSSGFAYLGLGHAFMVMEAYGEAICQLNRAIEAFPKRLVARVRIAACCAAEEEVERTAMAKAKVLDLYPAFSTKMHMQAMPYRDDAFKKRMTANLLKAGLPE